MIAAGSDEQKREWLSPLIEEPILCSFGLSEPDAGSDVARIKTNAVRKGDEYVLNGSKTFITNAGYAAWTVVFAKTDPSAGHKGMSAFIVPMDTPGVTIETHLDKMGQRSTDTSAFSMSDVVVPAANRLGEEGDGFKIAMMTLDGTRPGTAIGAVGVAQAAFEHACEYSKQRFTFEQPIAMHQGVNFLIADMATKIEARGCSPGRPRGCSTRAGAARRRSTRRWRSASPPTPPWRSRPTPSRSSAGTAT